MEDTFFIVRELQRAGYQVDFERVETQAAMERALRRSAWDVVITDYQMPSFDGMSALEVFKICGMQAPFIIVSGMLGEERAAEMLEAGANDYVTKDNLARLGPAVRRELDMARRQR